jgi:hypothetical protein
MSGKMVEACNCRRQQSNFTSETNAPILQLKKKTNAHYKWRIIRIKTTRKAKEKRVSALVTPPRKKERRGGGGRDEKMHKVKEGVFIRLIFIIIL